MAAPSARRYILAGIALALILGALGPATTAPPGRVAVKTILFLPQILPQVPFRPLESLTPAPVVEEVKYGSPSARGLLYRPGGGPPRGALVLVLGVNPLPLDDPLVARLVQGLARMGMVVLVHDSEDLRAGRVLPHEVDDLVSAFELLEARPFVQRGRIGFAGFSVGASLALLAAADSRVAERVAFVNAFGGYASAREMLGAIATRSVDSAGRREPWEPGTFTAQVFRQQLIDTVPAPEERALLEDLAQESGPPPGAESGLSPEGRAVLAALTERDPAQVPGRLAALSPAAQALLEALSPSRQLHRLRARLFLMHDRRDSYVPYTESRALAVAATGARLVRHTEFSLFEHVTPSGELEQGVLLPQLWKLLGHLQAVLQEVL